MLFRITLVLTFLALAGAGYNAHTVYEDINETELRTTLEQNHLINKVSYGAADEGIAAPERSSIVPLNAIDEVETLNVYVGIEEV